MSQQGLEKYLESGELLLGSFSADCAVVLQSNPSRQPSKGTVLVTSRRIMFVGLTNITLVGTTGEFYATARTNVKSVWSFITPPNGQPRRAIVVLVTGSGEELYITLADQDVRRAHEIKELLLSTIS